MPSQQFKYLEISSIPNRPHIVGKSGKSRRPVWLDQATGLSRQLGDEQAERLVRNYLITELAREISANQTNYRSPQASTDIWTMFPYVRRMIEQAPELEAMKNAWDVFCFAEDFDLGLIFKFNETRTLIVLLSEARKESNYRIVNYYYAYNSSYGYAVSGQSDFAVLMAYAAEMETYCAEKRIASLDWWELVGDKRLFELISSLEELTENSVVNIHEQLEANAPRHPELPAALQNRLDKLKAQEFHWDLDGSSGILRGIPQNAERLLAKIDARYLEKLEPVDIQPSDYGAVTVEFEKDEETRLELFVDIRNVDALVIPLEGKYYSIKDLPVSDERTIKTIRELLSNIYD